MVVYRRHDSSPTETGHMSFVLGMCNETSATSFTCSCPTGWEGGHCERQINYCSNVACFNRGVCRATLLDYTCECPGESYSGRHCEIRATKTAIRQAVCKSFMFVAMIAVGTVAMSLVVMDVLKYGFGIDPPGDDSDRMRRRRRRGGGQLKRKKTPAMIMRFLYVNASSQPSIHTAMTSV